MDALLAGETPGDADTWRLISERLAFQVVLEFGLRSRQGRTLELTRTAAAEVVLDDPDRIAALARDLHDHRARVPRSTGLPSPRTTSSCVRGILERLRVSGGIRHHWLENWLRQAGTKRCGTIWGNRPDGMPAFPMTSRTRRGVSAPAFLLGQRKDRSEFDVAIARQGWYADWTARCLGISRRRGGRLPAPAARAARRRGRAQRPHRGRRRDPRLRAAARPHQGPAARRRRGARRRPSAATPATGSRSSRRSAAATGRATPAPATGAPAR